MIDIEKLEDVLETEPHVLVTFKTKKGSTRVMDCTRLLVAIPEESTTIDSVVYHNDVSIGVYDHINSGTRAFRRDSVISYVVA